MSLYHRFHNRFGTAGVVLGVIALVLALGGSAIAAKGALTGKQKKEVEKIAKKYAGKPGAPGSVGPQGPPGANGKDGANGQNGTDGQDGAAGAQGSQGNPGSNGKSVNVTSIVAGGAKCEGRAGAEVKQEGAVSGTPVCDGKTGTTGFTETLPPGETETGSWAMPAGGAVGTDAISFSIPLAEGIDGGHTIYVKPGVTGGAGCAGGTVAAPKADPGFLCVYAFAGTFGNDEISSPTILKAGELELGASPTGAALFGEVPKESGFGIVWGTWAVTAP